MKGGGGRTFIYIIDRIMNDTAKPTVYEQACSKCIDNLYRTAYLTLADSDKAEGLVTKICVDGVRRYGNIKSESEIISRLFSDLYHLCRRKALFSAPSTDVLIAPLRVLTFKERLYIAMRFASGLSVTEICSIIVISEKKYSKKLDKIVKKSIKYR